MITFAVDFLDEESVHFFGSLKASRFIKVEQPSADDDDGIVSPPETLRHRLGFEMRRLQVNKSHGIKGIFVPYRHDKLALATSIPGRLVAGVRSLDGFKDDERRAVVVELTKNMTFWQSTRSLHSAPKVVKD